MVAQFVNRILPLIMLGLGVFGFITLMKSKEQPAPRTAEPVPPLVETMPVSFNDREVVLTADGVVVPFREITLAAEVEGRITKASDNFDAGRRVKAGDLLVEIDPSDYRNDVARLESEKAQAQSSVKELSVQIANLSASIGLAEDDLQLQIKEFERIQGLQRTGVSTPSALDAAKRNELTSRNNLVKVQNEKRLLEAQQERLEQAVNLVDVQLEKARLNLQRTQIKAPVDGIVVTASVETDDYIKKGESIGSLEDTSAVEVKTNLEMRTLAWVRAQLPKADTESLNAYELPKVPVTISYDLLGNTYTWQGYLDRYDGLGVDERTRTVPCRILVSDPQSVSLKNGRSDAPFAAPAALVRGMYVKVSLHSNPSEALLSVPEQALHPGNRVWAVRDGKLIQIDLPAIRHSRNEVMVAPQFTELRAGDQVVVSPLPTAAQTGMEVRVSDATLPGESQPGESKPDAASLAERDKAAASSARLSPTGTKQESNPATLPNGPADPPAKPGVETISTFSVAPFTNSMDSETDRPSGADRSSGTGRLSGTGRQNERPRTDLRSAANVEAGRRRTATERSMPIGFSDTVPAGMLPAEGKAGGTPQ